MNFIKGSGNDQKIRLINLTLAGIVGQVGCLTLVIILAALFGGLWLDMTFQTKHLFLFVLLLASIPVSVLSMLKIVRMGTARIKTGSPETEKRKTEEPFGKEK